MLDAFTEQVHEPVQEQHATMDFQQLRWFRYPYEHANGGERGG